MRLSRYLFIAALAAVCVMAPARLRADEAAGQAPSQYDETLQRALHEFALEHWIEAKVLFAQAQALRPNARVLRGLGLACYELRQYVQAIEHFEAALVNSVQPLTPEMTQDVHTFLARAREFVSHVKLEVQPVHAELIVDGDSQPRLDADGAYMLDPGPHEIVVTAPGFDQQTRRLFAEGGKTAHLRVTLRPNQELAPLTPPAAANVASLAAPASATEATTPSYVGPWVLVGVAGAVAVAGGVMLAVASVNKSRVENPEQNPMWSDYEESYDTGTALFPAGSVMLGVGLAGVAVGLGWRFLLTPETSESAAALDVSPCCLRISGRL